MDVLQDGHSLHGVGVPDTNKRVLAHLTRCHLNLIGVEGKAGEGVRERERTRYFPLTIRHKEAGYEGRKEEREKDKEIISKDFECNVLQFC